MERSVQSEAHNWERMASSDAVAKSAGVVSTPDANTAWSRRMSIPKTFHINDNTQQEDIVQMLVDPNSNYARAHGMAMKRAHDDEIISACYGAALDGDGTTTIPVDSGQIVGDGTAPISFDMITEVTEKFLANDVDPDEEKVWVLTPGDMRKLLQLTEATSADFNALRPLQAKGYVESWMGYTWVVSTRLAGNADDPAAAGVSNIVMSKKAIGFQVNKDITARVQEDPSISFAWRVYCHSTFGAVRVEDEHLVLAQTTGTV
jgi:hypothetical protein